MLIWVFDSIVYSGYCVVASDEVVADADAIYEKYLHSPTTIQNKT